MTSPFYDIKMGFYDNPQIISPKCVILKRYSEVLYLKRECLSYISCILLIGCDEKVAKVLMQKGYST